VKVFNLFDVESGEAIAAHVINTYHWSYRKNPELIFDALADRIKAMARMKAISLDGVSPPIKIKSRTLELAIPDATSAPQRRVLGRAVEFAASMGVDLVVTQITEGSSSTGYLERQILTLWARTRNRYGGGPEAVNWESD